jgi:hypothetical protein
MRSVFSLLAIFLLSGIVAGQIEGNPENWCRGGFFTSETEDFRVAVVKPLREKRLKRSYFHNDDRDDCPGGRNCQGRSYVVPGDELIVNRTYRGFACSWYSSPKGVATVGWISLGDIDFPEMLDDASLNAWLGEWQYAENTIAFTHNKLAGWLNVTGNAFWKGLGDNIHIGELDGRVEPKAAFLEYSDGDDEYDCKATMRLLGSYLIVSDNMKCGGANVSFSGIYRRSKRY